MIKILKEGNKTKTIEIKYYKAVCPECQCEFECNDEDFTGDGIFTCVKCPCCHRSLEISEGDVKFDRAETKEVPIDSYEAQREHLDKVIRDWKITPTKLDINFDNYSDPCTNCPSNPKLHPGQIYVGDSPCQWCMHSKTRVTCLTED